MAVGFDVNTLGSRGVDVERVRSRKAVVAKTAISGIYRGIDCI